MGWVWRMRSIRKVAARTGLLPEASHEKNKVLVAVFYCSNNCVGFNIRIYQRMFGVSHTRWCRFHKVCPRRTIHGRVHRAAQTTVSAREENLGADIYSLFFVNSIFEILLALAETEISSVLAGIGASIVPLMTLFFWQLCFAARR